MAETRPPPLPKVSFRPFLAADVVQLELQPSQHVTLGVSRAQLTVEDGRDLEEYSAGAWTAIAAGGRVLACFGLRMLWPAGPKTSGHAVLWALLATGVGAAHLAITRFLASVIAESPLTRIEAIVKANVKAEAQWPRLVGMDLAAELPAWGPDGGPHLLFQRIRPFVGGSAEPQPGQPGSAEAARQRLREGVR